ncbi:hypothetical protein I4F81_007849 [Pyropia yezoensis]|uniref:Uncharacterized protein n=1 Tax=Pyropia yezoensis TaxID=2788 RepID=A0ACC3C5R2_PYRYE|nr:hypothetical protein I4F81_007849 [Neopyropia yezoensis]
METLVRGTVRDGDFMAVLSLIQSLCPDEGHFGRFREWERVYTPPPAAKAPSLLVFLVEVVTDKNVPAEELLAFMAHLSPRGTGATAPPPPAGGHSRRSAAATAARTGSSHPAPPPASATVAPAVTSAAATSGHPQSAA